jgi:hypothetical protein
VTKLLHVHDQHILYGDNNFGGKPSFSNCIIGSNEFDNIDFADRGINIGLENSNNNSMRFLINRNHENQFEDQNLESSP